eukprot:2447324-Amphidinium_carterae.2
MADFTESRAELDKQLPMEWSTRELTRAVHLVSVRVWPSTSKCCKSFSPSTCEAVWHSAG